MIIPEKRLLTKNDLELWKSSTTFQDILKFLEELGNSVVGRENSNVELPFSSSIEGVSLIIEDIKNIFERHPVLKDKDSTRFGKLEFRDFYDTLHNSASDLILERLPGLETDQADELAVYLLNSFGDRQRIDYGSGHELNYLCFLYGLYKYDVLEKNDFTNMVLKLFIEYLHLMRLLEKEYWLEPAGSHGVWGLDDYHFLPFLFGAFQLSTHKHLKPKSIHNEEVVEMFAEKYMYFGCIAFINSVKTTASLRWHSPMLDDISGVKTWLKVSQGMLKMYNAEVLSKLPIMQHFYFGSFLKCPEGVTPPGTHTDDDHDGCGHDGCGHVNLHNTWGDCCGIQIPSAVAASAANNLKSNSGTSKAQPNSSNMPKRLPFD